jgi:hypothetical protein
MFGIQKLPLAAISSRNCRLPPLKVIQVVFIVSILRSIEQASAKQLACQHLGQHHLRWQFASEFFRGLHLKNCNTFATVAHGYYIRSQATEDKALMANNHFLW